MDIVSVDIASQILEIAERRMREAGYDAVSYRDIAQELEIKSSSLHSHFSKKEDLAIAMVRRYAKDFITTLESHTADMDDESEKLSTYVALYRLGFVEDNNVCLCAVLGAQAPALPHTVTEEIHGFFALNIGWLAARYEALEFAQPIEQAKITLSLMQGAMIISSVNNDISVFDVAAKSIKLAQK